MAHLRFAWPLTLMHTDVDDTTRGTGVVSGSAWMPWLVCLSAGLFFFYEFFQLNIFDVINEPLRNDFGINATALSWMSSTYLWADILFLLPAGLILDRYSTRSVILVAMMVCVFGTLGFALTQSFILACFFHFLSGIGNAFCFLSCVVLVSHWFAPKRQALVIGLIVTMAFLGGTMAHTPFSLLNQHLGWRHALMIDALLGVVFWVWIWFVVRDYPQEKHAEAKRHGQNSVSLLQSLRYVAANPQNWLAGLYTSLLNLPIMVLCALWGASFLTTVYGMSQTEASNAISLIFIGSMLGCPLAGFASDSIGKRKPYMILGAVLTVVFVAPLCFSIALPHFAIGILFFALGFVTSTQVISYPMVAESNPHQYTGTAMAVASTIIMGGGGVAQIMFGSLIQSHAGVGVTTYSAADFQFAFWMFPIAAICALVAVLLTRETFCKPQ